MGPPSGASLAERNRAFYDDLWSRARLDRPERFNTWPVISGLAEAAPRRLELGPGLHPHLPIVGTRFVDLSAPAVRQLNARGGLATCGDAATLPFANGHFDLVAALDVIEHTGDDRATLGEIGRVLKDGGILVCSVPLHPALWTDFDYVVGHARRYEAEAFEALLAERGFTVEQSAGFGSKPSSVRLVRLGMWFLSHRPAMAMRWYNRLFRPLGMRFQKPLHFAPGMIDTSKIQGLVLICRKSRGPF